MLPQDLAGNVGDVRNLRESYWPSTSVLVVRLVQLLPLLIVATLLTLPIPSPPDPAREAAAYFQSQALLYDGLESFTYVTFQESDASIHLFSILSAPLLELQYVEGGRLISWGAALGTTYLVAKCAAYLWGPAASLLAPSVLWINPYFVRFSYGFIPEALSIALTSAAVAAVLKYDSTGRDRWYAVGLFSIILAVLTHGWEAIVVLPFSSMLLFRREWGRAAFSWLVTIGAVAAVKYATSIQSGMPDTTALGVHNTGIGVFFTYEWWSRWLDPWYYNADYVLTLGPYSGPFYFAEKLTLIAGLAALLFWAVRALWTRRKTDGLMLTWAASGVSLLFLLPGGVEHHYYLWPAIVPIALSGAFAGHALYPRIRNVTDDRVAAVLLHAVLAVLVLSAVLYTGVFEAALFSSDAPRNADYASELGPNEAVEAGLEVRQHGVEDMSELAFVGDWSAQYEEDDPWRGNHWQTITRVLIYGGVNARGIWDVHELSPESDGGPTFTTDANTTDCTVKVRKVSESELGVSSCGPD